MPSWHPEFYTDVAAFLQSLAQRPPCLLCEDTATRRGVFCPSAPEVWGATRDQIRLVAYALCSRCHALPDHLARVEARLAAVLIGTNN